MGNIIDIDPFHTMLLHELDRIVLDVDECVVGHRDNAFTWVSVYITESTHLAHIYLAQSCQLEQGTVGCCIQALVAADEASVEAPFATTRVHISLTDQDLQLVLLEPEDDTVYG
jgi:hypothetical protein